MQDLLEWFSDPLRMSDENLRSSESEPSEKSCESEEQKERSSSWRSVFLVVQNSLVEYFWNSIMVLPFHLEATQFELLNEHISSKQMNDKEFRTPQNGLVCGSFEVSILCSFIGIQFWHHSL